MNGENTLITIIIIAVVAFLGYYISQGKCASGGITPSAEGFSEDYGHGGGGHGGGGHRGGGGHWHGGGGWNSGGWGRGWGNYYDWPWYNYGLVTSWPNDLYGEYNYPTAPGDRCVRVGPGQSCPWDKPYNIAVDTNGNGWNDTRYCCRGKY